MRPVMGASSYDADPARLEVDRKPVSVPINIARLFVAVRRLLPSFARQGSMRAGTGRRVAKAVVDHGSEHA